MSPPTNIHQRCDLLPKDDPVKIEILPKRLKEDTKDISDSSSGTSSDVEAVVVPPDGGWGWVIVFASFMSNMIVDGIIFSFGMFLSEIAASFNTSRSQVTLVGSLMSGFYLIVGPFASALANRYGFRLVAIIGSVLGSVAFVISYFATSVTFLCISYGVLGGIGFGFIYVPAVITVGYYFEKWRALATGIGVCGSGIGTFLFAPLSAYFIDKMGWRNALLCQGAIVASCLLFGLLYRPLKPLKLKDISKLDDTEEGEEEELSADIEKLPTSTRIKMEEVLKVMKSNGCEGNIHSIPKLLGVINHSDYPTLADVYHTIGAPQVPKKPLEMKNISFEKRSSVPHLYDNMKMQFESKKPLLKPMGERHFRRRTRSDAQRPSYEINRPLYRDDIFFSGSLKRLPEYTSKSSLAYNLAVTRMSTKNDIDEEKKHICKLFPEAVKRTLATMLDYTLLKSPSFLLLAFGGFMTMMGFYVPFMYLADRAKETMAPEMTVWLVSSIGIANTIGRVLCGLLSSFPGVNALFVTNVALTIGGIATMFSGLSMSEEYQFTYSVVFGLSIACFASLRSIIVVDLLGLENLTNAFGLLLLFQGVAACIGSPLAGAFMEWMGSYDDAFYLSGALLVASAVMCYPLNWVNKMEKKRKGQQNKNAVPA